MTVLSAKNTPRNSYTATGGQTDFTIGFEFFAVADVKVFKNATLMTYNADPSSTTTYKITGITNTSDEAYEFGNGGTVTFGSGLTAGDVVVIIRDIVVERTADFNPSGAFDVTSLNTQLDTIISMIADTQTQTERSVKLRDHDAVSANIELPVKNTRANKVLAFDSVGDVETTLTTTGLETIGTITSEIVTVASNDSNITTVAGNSSNITTVAGISSNVTAVADNTTNINAVNSNSSNINTVASANSNISTVAGANSNISTLAGINSDITTVAGISSNVTTVAGISSAVSTVASANSNISTVASGISNINTVAGSISNVNTVAGSISNVNTVASNVSGVNSFAERYRVGSSDPSSSLDAGDLFFNTTSNTLKFYDSSSWNVVASTFTIDGASDTNLTSPADGALLLYDAGTSKFIDNVVSGDATLADTGVLTIADDAVTYAKIQNVSATDRILGRDSAGAGVIEEITPANLRTMINVADGANAYTHPNHTGEVTSTADGATVIADDVVDEANLKVSNSPVNGYMLTAQSGASGGLTWAEAPSGGGGFTPTTLSGTSQSLNVGSFNFFNGGTHGGDTTLTFASVPTEANWKYTYKVGGTAFRLNKFIHHKHFVPTVLEGSGGDEGAGIRDIKFADSGTKMYILSENDCIIYQYDLSTAFDISTASYTSKKYELSTDHLSGFDLKSDGSILLAFTGMSSGNRTFKQIPLSTNFDLSTAGTRVNSSTFNQADAGSWRGMKVNSDGTKVFMASDQASDHGRFRIFRYDFTTGFDVSTVSYNDNFASFQNDQDIRVRGFTMSDDLTRIFTVDLDHDYVVERSLSSAGDLTSTKTRVASHNIPAEITIPNGGGIVFGDSGKKFYIGARQHEVDVNQFRVGDPHTLTLPSAVDNRLSPRDNFVPDDQVTLEFFTTNGGTNVTIIGDDVT